MQYIDGESRFQKILLPDVIDDYICSDNPARVIDVFVDNLDLISLNFIISNNTTGRPAYNPKDLLKLYIYGYFNRIRSSRKLEIETQRNIEVMWLLKRLSPDHKTISRFRKDNPIGLKNVFRKFVQVCNELDLYGKELIVIDGSKFKAVNALENNFGLKKLEDRLTRIDEHIEKYIKELDAQDENESDAKQYTKEEIENAIKNLNDKKEAYKSLQSQLKATGETQISTTDPDAKRMNHRNGLSEVCYNIQTSVDEKNKLIVEYEVTNRCNDKNLLFPMLEKSQEILNSTKMSVLADNGYFVATDIAKCIMNDGIPHVSSDYDSVTFCIEVEQDQATVPIEFENQGKNVFIEERNIGLCPMGVVLYPRSYMKSRKSAIYANSKACNTCSHRAICKKYHKTIEVVMPEERFSKVYNDKDLYVKQIHYTADKKLLKKRKTIVEHPFGTIKRHFDASYCLLKGKESVRGEFALTFLVYNLKRVINILGTQRLIHELGH